MIGIIDYGLGNVMAFVNVYRRCNIPVMVVGTPDELCSATKLILPGVGSFDQAMKLLDQSGMRSRLEDRVMGDGIPVLGVCVGMQMLAKSSDEGKLPGLGWIDAKVKRFEVSSLPNGTQLPHMGWNDVTSTAPGSLFKGMDNDVRFYFLHSYYFSCHDHSDILATSEYGVRFCCAVQHKNVYGVQFHPEKSHHFGSHLLQNYWEL